MLLQNNFLKQVSFIGGQSLIGPFFLSILLLSSCSMNWLKVKPLVLDNSKIPKVLNKDYVDQLESLSIRYLSSRNVGIVKLRNSELKYLKSIVKKITANNELLLDGPKKISFYLIKESAPVIFSLPGYQFFISSGLLKKYFKNESILISALAYEVIKSGRTIYRKKLLAPNNEISTKKITALLRIDHDERLLIYKWAFIALRRSGYDATALLNWIQTMNKNSVDFGWQLSNTRELSNDEFQFKSFLAEQGLEVMVDRPVNSSRSFYRLRDRI
jgi:hypothetical protein